MDAELAVLRAGLRCVSHDVRTEEARAVPDGGMGRSVHLRMDRHSPAFDARLVELGATLHESLPLTAERTAVVHGDFNPGNRLTARRQPWLAHRSQADDRTPATTPNR